MIVSKARVIGKGRRQRRKWYGKGRFIENNESNRKSQQKQRRKRGEKNMEEQKTIKSGYSLSWPDTHIAALEDPHLRG